MLLLEIEADDCVEALGQNNELMGRDRVSEVPAAEARSGTHLGDVGRPPRLADWAILRVGAPPERIPDRRLQPIGLPETKHVGRVQMKPDRLVVVDHEPSLAIGPQHPPELA
jgi:hypothetical protein